MLRPMAAVLGEISALPSRGGDETGRDRAKSIVTRLAGERGQATIEFTGILPLVAVVLILLWQIAMIGMTAAFGGHAARAGARAFAVGDDVKAAALHSLPGWWQHPKDISATVSSKDNYYGTVTVKYQIPLLIPGVSLPVSIPSSSGTVIEDQLMPGQTRGRFCRSGCGAATVAADRLNPGCRSTPGTTAQVLADGDATAPVGAPPQVVAMIAAANSIDQTPYPDPDQHYGSLAVPWPAYDCSGSTSFVLFKAGMLPNGNYVSEDWVNYQSLPGVHWVPGPGKWVTVGSGGATATS